MDRRRPFKADQKRVESLRREVQAAAEVYHRAATEYKRLLEEARAQSWKGHEEGHQTLYAAGELERHTVERYAQLVKALKDAVFNAGKPEKRRNTHSPKLKGRPLSTRESEILKLIADGLSSRKIADKLKISFRTAVAHRYHIMGKLGLHDVVTLVRYALRNKLVEP